MQISKKSWGRRPKCPEKKKSPNFLKRAVVGAAASMAGSFVAAQGNLRAQREREEEQRAAVERAFQRETYLAIQEAMSKCVRAAGMRHVEGVTAYGNVGLWDPNHLLSGEANSLGFEGNRELSWLEKRVTNDALRAEIAEFRVFVGTPGFTSQQESLAHLKAVSDRYEALQAHVGQAIRGLSMPYEELVGRGNA